MYTYYASLVLKWMRHVKIDNWQKLLVGVKENENRLYGNGNIFMIIEYAYSRKCILVKIEINCREETERVHIPAWHLQISKVPTLSVRSLSSNKYFCFWIFVNKLCYVLYVPCTLLYMTCILFYLQLFSPVCIH